MDFKLVTLEDKVEFFEARNLKELEKQISEQIEHNRAILLEVHSVHHQANFDYESGNAYYTAVVHFKGKK